MSTTQAAVSGLRTANDIAGRGIDIDPDHAAAAHEFQSVGAAVELRPEIIGAAHPRPDALFDHRQRERPTFAGRIESLILVPLLFGRIAVARTLGQYWRGEQAHPKGGRKEGSKQGHNESLVALLAQGIECLMNGPEQPRSALQ